MQVPTDPETFKEIGSLVATFIQIIIGAVIFVAALFKKIFVGWYRTRHRAFAVGTLIIPRYPKPRTVGGMGELLFRSAWRVIERTDKDYLLINGAEEIFAESRFLEQHYRRI